MNNRIVFLFGAGASKGATHITPNDPPLGSELYDYLIKAFPKEWGSGSRISKYDEALRKDFEKTMFNEVCGWNSTIDILTWQRCVSLCLSRFVIDKKEKNLYSRLLKFLLAKKFINQTIFATLNHDCLLEQAMENLGLQVNYSFEELFQSGIPVLKVHGSSNFITEDLSKYKYMLTNPNTQLGCRMEALPIKNLSKILQLKFSDAYADYFPVISIYASYKNILVANTKIQEIRNKWNRYVSTASVVVLVGVSFTHDDSHIHDVIRATKAKKLYYLGGDYENWAKVNSKIEFLGKRFYKGFEKLCNALQI